MDSRPVRIAVRPGLVGGPDGVESDSVVEQVGIGNPIVSAFDIEMAVSNWPGGYARLP